MPRSSPKAISEMNPEKGVTIKMKMAAFWRHLSDLGSHLEPSGAPRGSQNQEFWCQDAPKSQKMTFRMRHQKKYEFVIEFCLENVRF